jgi:redox-sensitive bicupin YhaK (pirin superfamily)
MLKKRPAKERGHANHGWLDSYHTFSFADYHDRNHMSFRDLRVINEDFVKGGMGFPTHSHQDFEIISFVQQGKMEHKDSMGNTAIMQAGEVQRMSAGTGVTHSEFNHLSDEVLHLLQIWIQTEKKGIAPSYEQKSFNEKLKHNRLCLLVSREGFDGSVSIHQDVNIYESILEAGKTIAYEIPKTRHVWIQMIKGQMQVTDETLEAGDGLAVSDESDLKITAKKTSKFLLFDLK